MSFLRNLLLKNANLISIYCRNDAECESSSECLQNLRLEWAHIRRASHANEHLSKPLASPSGASNCFRGLRF